MRFVCTWLLSCIFVACLTSLALSSTPDADNVTTRSRASMVIVSSRLAEHRDAIGAGVVVAVQPHRIRIITARHVVDRGPVTIWIDRRPFAAEIVRTFANRDLAIVDTVGENLDMLGVRAAGIGPVGLAGSPLSIWGENEAGLRIVSASVKSSAYVPNDGSGAGALLSIACDRCAPGDSGGGIFDAAGRLVAILTARYFTPDNQTVAIVGEPVDVSAYAITDGPFDLTASRGAP